MSLPNTLLQFRPIFGCKLTGGATLQSFQEERFQLLKRQMSWQLA